MARKSSVLKSVLTVVATIIGAGIFALPPLFAQVGFWPGTILFGLLACLALTTHLFLVEIILTHKHGSRLTGFAKKELGPLAHWISAWTYPLSLVGSNLAYLILGGEFLAILSSLMGFTIPVLAWQMLFWVGGTITVFRGMKMVAKVESYAAWFLILIILVVAVVSTYVSHPEISSNFLRTWNPSWVPFGVFLFSLSGVPAVGMAVDLVKYNARDAYRAVTIGTVGAAVLSWIFGVTLVIASSNPLASDIAGFMRSLPAGLGWLIPLVGFLAVATSYITMSEDLKMTFDIDFRLSSQTAWCLAMGLPLVLLIFTARDFLSVVGSVGAIFGSINGILVALIAIKIFERHKRPDPFYLFVMPVLVILAYLTGMLQKLFF